jgi:hypothetical protein
MMRIATIAFCALLGSGTACAETLYKLVAPNGKVTYSQEAPKNFDGKVIRLDIDPNANTAEGKRPPSPKARNTNEEIIHRDADAPRRQKLEAAQEKLQAARAAFENARDNPGTADVQRLGTVKGGARPVFSEEYQRKLEKLEADMKAAQDEVDKLERGF